MKIDAAATVNNKSYSTSAFVRVWTPTFKEQTDSESPPDRCIVDLKYTASAISLAMNCDINLAASVTTPKLFASAPTPVVGVFHYTQVLEALNDDLVDSNGVKHVPDSGNDTAPPVVELDSQFVYPFTLDALKNRCATTVPADGRVLVLDDDPIFSADVKAWQMVIAQLIWKFDADSYVMFNPSSSGGDTIDVALQARSWKFTEIVNGPKWTIAGHAPVTVGNWTQTSQEPSWEKITGNSSGYIPPVH